MNYGHEQQFIRIQVHRTTVLTEGALPSLSKARLPVSSAGPFRPGGKDGHAEFPSAVGQVPRQRYAQGGTQLVLALEAPTESALRDARNRWKRFAAEGCEPRRWPGETPGRGRTQLTVQSRAQRALTCRRATQQNTAEGFRSWILSVSRLLP